MARTIPDVPKVLIEIQTGIPTSHDALTYTIREADSGKFIAEFELYPAQLFKTLRGGVARTEARLVSYPEPTWRRVLRGDDPDS